MMPGSSCPRIDCPAVADAHTANPHHVWSVRPIVVRRRDAEIGVRLGDPEVAQHGVVDGDDLGDVRRP